MYHHEKEQDQPIRGSVAELFDEFEKLKMKEEENERSREEIVQKIQAPPEWEEIWSLLHADEYTISPPRENSEERQRV